MYLLFLTQKQLKQLKVAVNKSLGGCVASARLLAALDPRAHVGKGGGGGVTTRSSQSPAGPRMRGLDGAGQPAPQGGGQARGDLLLLTGRSPSHVHQLPTTVQTSALKMFNH